MVSISSRLIFFCSQMMHIKTCSVFGIHPSRIDFVLLHATSSLHQSEQMQLLLWVGVPRKNCPAQPPSNVKIVPAEWIENIFPLHQFKHVVDHVRHQNTYDVECHMSGVWLFGWPALHGVLRAWTSACFICGPGIQNTEPLESIQCCPLARFTFAYCLPCRALFTF